MTRIATLKKSFGPLSSGTRVEVISFPGKKWEKRGDVSESGYATVRLEHISPGLRECVKHKHRWVLKAFDIEADLLVFPRGQVVINAL